MATPIAEGTKAPDFALPSHQQTMVRLSDILRAGKPVVVFFYPLDWTPV